MLRLELFSLKLQSEKNTSCARLTGPQEGKEKEGRDLGENSRKELPRKNIGRNNGAAAIVFIRDGGGG
jgi:hypothetical protein